MKLHTSLSATEVHEAMDRAKKAGRVDPRVCFTEMKPQASRSHAHGYVIHLGTEYRKSPLAGTKNGRRRWTNSGVRGSGGCYAASYDEWGWLIAELMAADPGAAFGPYKGLSDFNRQTGSAYVVPGLEALARRRQIAEIIRHVASRTATSSGKE